MIKSTERVFIVGGTGNIGTRTVKDLLAKKVAATLYARNPSEVSILFPADANLKAVQGDFSDLIPLKEGIKGNTQLFLLVEDLKNMIKIKSTIATYAYEAGVKQIVDISSITAGFGWRSNHGGIMHAGSEQSILDNPNRGAFVALRPGRFMSNSRTFFRLISDSKLIDCIDPNKPQCFISANGIGEIAANIPTEDVEKHGDAVYERISVSHTLLEQAEILSKITDRQTTYQKISELTDTTF